MPEKVVHCKIESFDVYIGRGSWEGVRSIWGNPYSHKEGTAARFKVETVAEAIECFEQWLRSEPQLMGQLWRLRWKTLGCWCKTVKHPDAPCHGDVLARLAEESYIPFAGDWHFYRHLFPFVAQNPRSASLPASTSPLQST